MSMTFHAKTPRCNEFGLRWQSAAATPLLESGNNCQSGVALRFPPQSKKVLGDAMTLCAWTLNFD
jgi:hypothetical protein